MQQRSPAVRSAALVAMSLLVASSSACGDRKKTGGSAGAGTSASPTPGMSSPAPSASAAAAVASASAERVASDRARRRWREHVRSSGTNGRLQDADGRHRDVLAARRGHGGGARRVDRGRVAHQAQPDEAGRAARVRGVCPRREAGRAGAGHRPGERGRAADLRERRRVDARVVRRRGARVHDAPLGDRAAADDRASSRGEQRGRRRCRARAFAGRRDRRGGAVQHGQGAARALLVRPDGRFGFARASARRDAPREAAALARGRRRRGRIHARWARRRRPYRLSPASTSRARRSTRRTRSRSCSKAERRAAREGGATTNGASRSSPKATSCSRARSIARRAAATRRSSSATAASPRWPRSATARSSRSSERTALRPISCSPWSRARRRALGEWRPHQRMSSRRGGSPRSRPSGRRRRSCGRADEQTASRRSARSWGSIDAALIPEEERPLQTSSYQRERESCCIHVRERRGVAASAS